MLEQHKHFSWARTFAIFVKETAQVLSAPLKNETASFAACASK